MKHARLLATLTLLALLLPPLLGVQVASGREGYLYCEVPIAAVSSSGEGVLGRLRVAIEYPGSGKVFISTSPATRIDTLGSARVAAFVASAVAGVDMRLYNFYYEIESPSIIVGGPSAGLAMAIVTYSLLASGGCPQKPFVATGMILPDGTVGPVGGLKEKLEATANAGIDTFIIPRGQETYVYVERVSRRIGPIVVVERKPVELDLVEYGKSLGVEVLPASTLLDAVKALGLEIPARGSYGIEPPSHAVEALEGYVTDTLREVEVLLSEPYNRLEEEAARLREDSLSDLKGGLAYSAAVKATIALAYAIASDSVEKAVSTGTYEVTGLVKEAENSYSVVEEKLKAMGVPSLEGLDSALKAYGVLAQASFEFKQALETLVKDGDRYYLPASPLRGVDVRGALHAALSLALSRWALFWANLAAEAGGEVIAWSQLGSLASLLEAQASSTAAYAIQLGEETGRGGYERVAYLASLAVSARDPLEAAGYSIEAIAAASTYLYQAFGVDASSAVESVRELTLTLASNAPKGALLYPKLALASLQGFKDPTETLTTASKALLYTIAVSMVIGSEASETPPPSEMPTKTITQTPNSPATTGGQGEEGIKKVEASSRYPIALLLLAVAIISMMLGVALGTALSRVF